MKHTPSFQSVLELAKEISGAQTPSSKITSAQQELLTKIAAISAGLKNKDAAARLSAVNSFKDLCQNENPETVRARVLPLLAPAPPLPLTERPARP